LLLNINRLLLNINGLLHVGRLPNSFINQQTPNNSGNTPTPAAAITSGPLTMWIAVTMAMLSHGRQAEGHEDEGNEFFHGSLQWIRL
jgi:hypothetical protein